MSLAWEHGQLAGPCSPPSQQLRVLGEQSQDTSTSHNTWFRRQAAFSVVLYVVLVLQGNPLNQIPLGPAVFSTVWRFPQIRGYKVHVKSPYSLRKWQIDNTLIPLSIHAKSPFSLQKWQIGNTPMPLPHNVKSAFTLKMVYWQYTHAIANYMKSLHSLWKWQIDNTLMPLPKQIHHWLHSYKCRQSY